MVEYLDFNVGEREIHKVQFYNDYGGHYIVVSVDGKVISGERSIPLIPSKYPVLRKGKEIEFRVGKEEVHQVRMIFHSAGKMGIIMGCDVTVEIDNIPFRTFKSDRKGILD